MPPGGMFTPSQRPSRTAEPSGTAGGVGVDAGIVGVGAAVVSGVAVGATVGVGAGRGVAVGGGVAVGSGDGVGAAVGGGAAVAVGGGNGVAVSRTGAGSLPLQARANITAISPGRHGAHLLRSFNIYLNALAMSLSKFCLTVYALPPDETSDSSCQFAPLRRGRSEHILGPVAQDSGADGTEVLMMQPFPKDEWTRYGGLRMHVRNWGGEGRPVVLLHGLASTCRIWDFVAPILACDFAVIAVDQRGHGDSGKPDHGYDFASVGRDVAALLEGRGIERPVLVGHSWGADVALELAVTRPELLQGLVFVDGGTIDASARYDTLDDTLVQMAPPDFSGVTPKQFMERVRSGGQWATLIGQHGASAEEIILANFETLEDGTMRAKLSRDNHLRIIEALWEHHPRELYPQVDCPVLMMPARQRANPDAYERTLARSESIAAAERLLPLSKTVWLEDSIHDVPVQRPELVAETIREHIFSGFFD